MIQHPANTSAAGGAAANCVDFIMLFTFSYITFNHWPSPAEYNDDISSTLTPAPPPLQKRGEGKRKWNKPFILPVYRAKQPFFFITYGLLWRTLYTCLLEDRCCGNSDDYCHYDCWFWKPPDAITEKRWSVKVIFCRCFTTSIITIINTVSEKKKMPMMMTM